MLQGYLELKLSWQLFQKAPETLSEPERNRLLEVAGKQNGIEQRILASAAAANVVVPAATLATRVAEVRKRYASEDEFAQDLERSGLNETTLGEAVERDLRVESVLEKIASATAPVSAVDAEIYYRLHPEAFDRPEARRLRHILITFDNAQEKARATAQLESLRSTLQNAEKFAAAAARHSQCPTAMEVASSVSSSARSSTPNSNRPPSRCSRATSAPCSNHRSACISCAATKSCRAACCPLPKSASGSSNA